MSLLLLSILLTCNFVMGLPKAEPLMKYIFKELENKASCVVVVLDHELYTEETLAFVKNTQLPIYVYTSNDVEAFSLDQSSSYCRKHLFAFKNIKKIEKFMQSYEKVLAQRDTIYLLAAVDPFDYKTLGMSFLDLILNPICNKLKKIVMIGRDNDFRDNDKFWILIQKYTQEGKRYDTTLWKGDRLMRDGVELFPEQLKTFHGRRLRASTFPYKPFITVEKVDENGVITKFGGIETRILNVLAEKLDFDYGTISLPTDGQLWGSELPNGSFTGLVGDVMFEKTDIGYAQFFVTPSRMDRIDFTQAYDTDRLCFIVAKPPPLPQWLSLAYPLQVQTWLGVALAVCGSIGFFYIYSSVAKGLQAPFNFTFGVFFYLGTFFDASQPLTSKIRDLSIRLAYAIFLLSIYVVTIGYRGSLISVLSVPHQSPPIDSIKEMAEVSTPVASFGPIFYNTLASSTDNNIRTIYNKFNVHYDFEEAFQNLSKREIIMSEGRRFLDYSMRERFTDKFGFSSVHIIKECYGSFRIAFATTKNGIYTHRLGDKIMQLNAGGIIEKWISKELDLIARLSKSEATASHKKLTIFNLEGPFYLWLVCIGISISAFAYETLWITKKQDVLK